MVLAGIPRIGRERKNEGRQFVHLIDALDEGKVNLICSAGAGPDARYPEGDAAFAFQRTASRLIEMQSGDYLAQAHRHGATGHLADADSSIVKRG